MPRCARRAALAVLLVSCVALLAAACSSDPSEQASEEPPSAVDPGQGDLGLPDGASPPTPAEPGGEADPDPDPEPVGPPEGLVADCGRPYQSSSAWNTPIAPSVVYDGNSDRYVAALGDRLTSDPTQFTYPVYEITAETPLVEIEIEGWFSNVTGNGRTMENEFGATAQFPIPAEAEPAAGSDSQVILVDPETGDEWGAWQFRRTEAGTYVAENAYHYNTTWDAVPPPSTGGGVFVNRGAGVPYLVGLVRACEIEAGRIDHALAFAYDSPSGDYVYPATKSDGEGAFGEALPEGARLQLDPNLSPEDLAALGCEGPCLTVARALQDYGMIVIDNSGRSKVMFEYIGTAGWGGTIDENTVSPLPLERFRVLDTRTIPVDAGCTITGTEGDDVLEGTKSADVICGLGGNDQLRGFGGNDVIYGGEGEDRILGGGGQDAIDAGPGADIVVGGDGRDVIDPGIGEDRVIGGRGSDRVLARDGEQDSIDGGLGRDEASLDAIDTAIGVE